MICPCDRFAVKGREVEFVLEISMMRSVAGEKAGDDWWPRPACGRIDLHHEVEGNLALKIGVCLTRSIVCLILIGLIVSGWSEPCAAEDGLAATKHRQTVMDRLGDDMKAIKRYVTGQADLAAALSAAQDLDETASLVPSLFPKGSDSAKWPGKSAAKPEIWDNPDDFQQLLQALSAGTADLRKSVGTGEATNVQSSMRALAKNACGACHENYRGRRDGE